MRWGTQILEGGKHSPRHIIIILWFKTPKKVDDQMDITNMIFWGVSCKLNFYPKSNEISIITAQKLALWVLSHLSHKGENIVAQLAWNSPTWQYRYQLPVNLVLVLVYLQFLRLLAWCMDELHHRQPEVTRIPACFFNIVK